MGFETIKDITIGAVYPGTQPKPVDFEVYKENVVRTASPTIALNDSPKIVTPSVPGQSKGGPSILS